jgi:ABC-2 type transport system permease protein
LLLVATAGLIVGLSAATVAAVELSPGSNQDVVKISLTGVQLGQALVGVLAVLAISSEYSTGMIGTTLTAMPRRGTVLVAKATLLAGIVMAVSTVGTLGSVLVGRVILPGNGFTAEQGYPPLSLADGSTLRAAGGTVVYLTLVALLSLGVATALRDAALSIGVVLGVLYLAPIVALSLNDDWKRHLQRLTPSEAGLAIQATTNLRALPISPWAGLGVLGAWTVAALLVGSLLLRHRDA